ncbi:hypothetical protein QLS71_001255 [Mariniflexile litorale]|uniref:Uncharacterized protein n=1 Tax=Mariniflexile litorale TaxID=3045158 RepID=A0AAU7EGI7_9FLAO|nr:hypothetical protein [Mariniflexile sp. KMM 9835]MDQ8210907.1 hypothetical protein [Mariniflexile sp. KMM 9835]
MTKFILSNFFQLKKISFESISILLFFTLGCDQQTTKTSFKKELNTKKTTIKDRVHNWPTDTVYFATFTFHSPYSTVEGFQILTPDKNFELNKENVDKPFVLFLTPERKFLDLRKDVLFENLTDKYFRGYCQRFYDYPITTYLIEPGTETEVELTKTTRYGKTLVKFLNPNKYNSEYYQTTFELDNGFDEVLDPRFDATLKDIKNIDNAIRNLNNKLNELLTKLDKEQQYISPFLYNYTKSEIEFGGKKEFLRYLLLDHKEETSKIFRNKIPEKINNVIEFKKENIDYATLISQEYNEYLELYLNFKLSKLKNKLITYKEFDKEKFDFALKELPQTSKYYYLANNLLHLNYNEQTKELVTTLIDLYPDGKLNDKLLKKYN